MSWDEAFAERYDEWSAAMTADVAFYVELAREADGPLVELAVGNGRVAIPVAQAIGRPVIGIDTSPAMLELARASAAEAGVELELHEGDMRDLALDEPAALDLLPVPRAAPPADVGRPAPHLRAGRGLAPARRPVRVERVRARPQHRRRVSTARRRPIPFRTRSATPSATTASTSRSTTAAKSSLWWATKNEWLGLIDVAGLEVESLHGGFAGEPFGDDSREYVFVVRR